MEFSLKQRIQDNNLLWAIAFSPDTFIDGPGPSTTATKNPTTSYNQDNPSYHCFATCGGPRVTIYECRTRKGYNREGDRICHPRQSYTSSYSDEDFYALAFARRRSRLVVKCGNDNEEKEPQVSRQVLCVGGASAKILVLDVETGRLEATLKGGFSYISDLKAIHCGNGAQKYNLLCSATRDQIRIWNLDTQANVCIFAGDPSGHIGDVLTVAWHATGSRIVSGGGESPVEGHSNTEVRDGKKFQICIWNVLESRRLKEAIQASSYLPNFANDRSQFNPHIESIAASAHDDVHLDKVDCVAWLGDLVLSKSIFDEIILWKPAIHDDSNSIGTSSTSKSSIIPIKIFHYARNDCFYFVRFALLLDPFSSLLAIGNNCGQVYIWDIDNFDNDGYPQIIKASSVSSKKKLKLNEQDSIIRGLSFSPDGEILVGCDANGDVYCWDKH